MLRGTGPLQCAWQFAEQGCAADREVGVVGLPNGNLGIQGRWLERSAAIPATVSLAFAVAVSRCQRGLPSLSGIWKKLTAKSRTA